MRANNADYDHEESYARMRLILETSDNNYEESKSLPDRDRLTYTNGYYSYCTAMFIDIRKSSDLPSKYKRPRLAKLYRAYISEVVAVMNDSAACSEINIVGDGVWGVYDTPLKSDIDSVFSVAARTNSVIKMLNYRLEKSDYEPIKVGIGVTYGRALVIKAGLSGSGLSDIVYMGDVVNHAAKLAAHGNETYFDRTVMVSEVFYNNLKTDNKTLLDYHASRDAYHGEIINVAMDNWFNENCL